MAEQVNNKKGFMILKISRTEILSITQNSQGTCDSCNGMNNDIGYYISVLNSWFCPDCFDKWYASSDRFPEDIKFEEQKFTSICLALKSLEN